MAEERESLSETELMEQLQEEMRRITVPEYLRHLLVSLSSMGFQRLGLTAESREERDLAQSRMAIDAFEALVDVLSPTFSKEEESLFRSALHEMRMAFVRASGSESSEPSGSEPSEPAGSESSEPPGSEPSELADSEQGEPPDSEAAGEGDDDGEG